MLQERLNAVKGFLQQSDGNINDALSIIDRFKTLHDEIMAEHGVGDKLYHEAKIISSTAMCWILTEYGMNAEAELLFGNAQYHIKKLKEL